MPNLKGACVVEFLDGTAITVETKQLQKGCDLQKYACELLGVTERNYFGLWYTHHHDQKMSWLEMEKPLIHQLRKTSNCRFHLAVQFFPESIQSLRDEITRYQFVLQIRENLLVGRWSCSIPTQALLASFIVQAEFGNYDGVKHGLRYLDGLQFSCLQNSDFLEKVNLFHQQHRDVSSSDADWRYLEIASKTIMYGMDIHSVQDGDGNNLTLGIDFQGMHIIFLNTRLHSFIWSLISKISYEVREVHISIKMVSDDELSESATVIFISATEREAKRVAESANKTKLFHENERNWYSHAPPRTHPPMNFKRVSSHKYSQMFEKFPDWMTTGSSKINQPSNMANLIGQPSMPMDRVTTDSTVSDMKDVRRKKEKIENKMCEDLIVPENVAMVESADDRYIKSFFDELDAAEEAVFNAPSKKGKAEGESAIMLQRGAKVTKSVLDDMERNDDRQKANLGRTNSFGTGGSGGRMATGGLTRVGRGMMAGAYGNRLGVADVVMMVKEGVVKDEMIDKRSGKDFSKKEERSEKVSKGKEEEEDKSPAMKKKDKSAEKDEKENTKNKDAKKDTKKSDKVEKEEKKIDVDAVLKESYDVLSDDDVETVLDLDFREHLDVHISSMQHSVVEFLNSYVLGRDNKP